MDVMLLDAKYNLISIVDQYKGLNWAVREREAGDFELILPATPEYFSLFDVDQYVSIEPESDRYMIVEKIVCDTSVEEGDWITVTGRSLESILDRRVISQDTRYSGSLQDTVVSLITNNCINVSESRKIPGLSIKKSEDPEVTGVNIELTNFYKKNLYETICTLCERYKLGFRVLPKGEGGFEFELYKGVDRSWNQNENSYVVFSPKFENLISTNYVKTSAASKNACYVNYDITISGMSATDPPVEYSHTFHLNKEVSEDGAVGLKRREITVDSELESVTTDSDISYLLHYPTLLEQEGLNALADQKEIEAMDGELDTYVQFKYGVDYFLGDIVQVENAYGIKARCAVIEFVLSDDASGITRLPTFEFLTEENEEE